MSPNKRKQLLAKYAEEVEQASGGNGAPFKASVVRYRASEGSMRNKLSNDDLRDMFAGMSLNKSELAKSELSTVHEDPRYATLTEENVQRFNDSADGGKSALLQRFADGDDDDFEEDGEDGFGAEDDTFDMKVRSRQQRQQQQRQQQQQHDLPKQTTTKIANPFVTPVSKYTVKGEVPRSESLHSLSSASTKSGPSAQSASSFTETDSESDYGDDFEEEDADEAHQEVLDKAALVSRMQRRQHAAELRAQQIQQQQQQQQQLQRQRVARPQQGFVEKVSTISEDFDDFDGIDASKLRRFKIVNDKLDRKRSMPLLIRSGSTKTIFSGSPKRTVRKYSSTLDLPSQPPPRSQPLASLSLKSRPYYNSTALDDIDDLEEDADLTITLSDYKKLKRKSRRIDITQFAEEAEPTHYHRSTHRHRNGAAAAAAAATSNATNTARLSKEGKLKIIRAMGRHKARQVLPGHMYGEIVYDPDQMKWCGNEEDLLRFESTSRPSLIRHSVSQHHIPNSKATEPQIVGSMMYDNKNLRWVSITGKYEDDPFEGMDDTITSLGGFQKSRAGVRTRQPTRQASRSRLTSSASSSSLSSYRQSSSSSTPEDYFDVSPESFKAWKSEESRWLRKVGNWFPAEDDGLAFCYELKAFLNDQ